MINISTMPVITAIVYMIIEMYKGIIKSERAKRFIPIISGTMGGVLGILTYFFVPKMLPTADLFCAIIIGIMSGFSSTGINQIIRQMKKNP